MDHESIEGQAMTSHIRSLSLSLLVLPLACSTVVASQRPTSNDAARELNRLLDAELVTVTTSPDGTRRARVEVGEQQTVLIDDRNQTRRTVPTAALRTLELPRQHGRGALDGAVLGVLGGALLGATMGLASGDDTCNPQQWCIFKFSAAQKAEFGAALLGAGGLLIGALVGAAIGHSTILEFDPQPPR